MIRHNVARHDITQWPFALSFFQDTMMYDEQVGFLKAWNGWLDRNEPFFILRVFSNLASLETPKEGIKYSKNWLQENAERMKSLVMGIATVIPVESYGQMSKMDMGKLFGVPAKIFCDIELAIAWTDEILSQHNILVDYEAAKQFLVEETNR